MHNSDPTYICCEDFIHKGYKEDPNTFAIHGQINGETVLACTLGASVFSSAVSGFCSPLVASAFGQHRKFPPHARKTSGTQGSLRVEVLLNWFPLNSAVSYRGLYGKWLLIRRSPGANELIYAANELIYAVICLVSFFIYLFVMTSNEFQVTVSCAK